MNESLKTDDNTELADRYMMIWPLNSLTESLSA